MRQAHEHLKGCDLSATIALARLLLPAQNPEDPQVLGQALYLWEIWWEHIEVAVQNAIAKAFKGK